MPLTQRSSHAHLDSMSATGMGTSVYGASFYENQQGWSYRAAQEVVPPLISLLRPANVLDVGCGIGTWLKVFMEHGIEDVQGIDGEYVNPSQLMIPKEKFLAADLTQKIDLKRQFDLVLSLEVAEHLPFDSSASFVENLTAHGKVIVFSAAVPGQGGVSHINEQWPDYWKILFEARGYTLVNCLRRRFWSNKRIAPWYKQNMLLYVDKVYLLGHPKLLEEHDRSKNLLLSVVHPDLFAQVRSSLTEASDHPPGLRKIMHALPHAVSRAVRVRVGKFVGRSQRLTKD
jgi:SAM-dependent methyltransferase